MRSLLMISVAAFLFFSCNTSRQGLFGKKTPHEKYADGLESAGLRTTSLGTQWFVAADRSLSQPLSIQLPYKETGYFAAEKPRAAGYRFTAQTGDRLLIKITTTPATGVYLFSELWRPAIGNDKHKLLQVIDSTTRQLEYDVEKETDFLIRIQPELLKGVEYTMTITTQPSLAFPVDKSGKPRIISLWGTDRDGGRRSHEGIDIGAPKRTPAIASADGRVTRVGENELGGKVVFMNPDGKDYNLYYAHLDSQLVSSGQRVKKGDVLGLVGNTGNARTTPPHLHFGIYGYGGAIDPLPFVDPERKEAPAITASLKQMNEFVRNRVIASIYAAPSAKALLIEKLEPNQIVQVIAAYDNWYKVIRPDLREGFISSSAITVDPVRQLKITKETRLLDSPDMMAAAKRVIASGSKVSVIGSYGSFYFIAHENERGWIISSL